MIPAERSLPTVAIVGGGFGGMAAARNLRDTPAKLVVIDQHNYHLFQPLLYQVATAGLSPAEIAQPIRTILRDHDNTRVIMARAEKILLHEQTVMTQLGPIAYDYLVVATGATHNYFGHDDWERWAPGLKTIEDALEIRRRVLAAFENAELKDNEQDREAELTFVVVGGGPTGVEMAGALREIAASSIPLDFRRVDTTTARIVLVQGGDRLLPSMSEAAGARARRDLERMGVEVRLSAKVTRVEARGVHVGDEFIGAANVIWAAGVRGSSLARSMGVELDGSGRVPVNGDCSVPHHPNVFVIGDLAAIDDAQTGEPVPGVAQGAIQMGAMVGRILHEEIAHNQPIEARPAFVYRDKGAMATIGKNKAVADVGERFIGGFWAWVLWGAVHISFLVGFRNKILVFLNWIWNYFVHTRGARLITESAGVPPDQITSGGSD